MSSSSNDPSSSSSSRTLINPNVMYPINTNVLGPIRRPKAPLSTLAGNNNHNSYELLTTQSTTTTPIANIISNSNGTTTSNLVNCSTTSSSTSTSSSSDVNFMKDFLKLLAELNAKLLLINKQSSNESSTSSSSSSLLLINERNMIIEVCSLIKIYGNNIDNDAKDNNSSFGSNDDAKLLLDEFFRQLINLIESNVLDIVTRGHVLHVLELRNNRWQQQQQQQSVNPVVQTPIASVASVSSSGQQQPLIGAVGGHNVDVTHKQVQWQQSTSPASSNDEKLMPMKDANSRNAAANQHNHYLKGELLIRNCDSGKVMGVKGRRVRMIEELSDTIISFQKVNKDDRDRRLQITGSNAFNIETAKRLIVDTIRRNASPVPTADDSDMLDIGNPFVPSPSMPQQQYVPFNASGQQYNPNNQQPFLMNANQQQASSAYDESGLFKRGLQKSSSLGISLKPKADGLYSSSIRPAIYDVDDVIYMSSNNHLLLNEAVNLISNHFDLMKRTPKMMNNTLINTANYEPLIGGNVINKQTINQQQTMKNQQQTMFLKKRFEGNVPSSNFGSGNVASNITNQFGNRMGTLSRNVVGSSNSYDDLLRPLKYQSSQSNLQEEDETDTVAIGYKYFANAPSMEGSNKPGLTRIKNVIQSSTSSESSPLFGDFLHRDSFDINSSSTTIKSGLSMVKAVKKSASSNMIYSRQSSTALTPPVAEDDLLINLDTSSPWCRVEPLQPLKRTASKVAFRDDLLLAKDVAKDAESLKMSADGKDVPVEEEEQKNEDVTISYDKLTLIKLSKSNLSRQLPNDYESMKLQLPDIMI